MATMSVFMRVLLGVVIVFRSAYNVNIGSLYMNCWYCRGKWEKLLDWKVRAWRAQILDTPVDQLWPSVRNKIQDTMDKYVPSKLTSSRFNQPWITGDQVHSQVAEIHWQLSLHGIFPNGEESWIVIQNPQKTLDHHQNVAINQFLLGSWHLTLPPGWTGSYTCPALRPYQLGPMRVPECNQKVTGSGHKAVTAVMP